MNYTQDDLLTCYGYDSLKQIFYANDLKIKTFFLKGDVRCFCNLPVCVKSNYMCKSIGLNVTCFMRHGLDYVTYGCTELVKSNYECVNQDDWISSNDSLNKIQNKNSNRTICCKEDMCNYIKNWHFSNDNQERKNEKKKGI